jgi:hypothetical protein
MIWTRSWLRAVGTDDVDVQRQQCATELGDNGNWPDAIAAYNWGPGNMDAWIGGGRPSTGFPLEVERYRDRVLRDVGVDRATAALLFDASGQFPAIRALDARPQGTIATSSR